MRTSQYLLVVVVVMTAGCRSSYLYDDEKAPFVRRQLTVEVRDFDTGEPLEGVEVKRLIVKGVPWSLGHKEIYAAVDITPSDGILNINIDRPGMAISFAKDGYWVCLFTRRSGVYIDSGVRLTEHNGYMIVPMRVFNKPGPLHPEWLSDDYKLPLPGKRK